MNEPENELETAYCSFCLKPYREAGPLVEGPDKVFICYKCSQRCFKLVEDEAGRRGKPLLICKPKRLRFSIRDLLLITTIVALTVGWLIDHQDRLTAYWSGYHFGFSSSQRHVAEIQQ